MWCTWAGVVMCSVVCGSVMWYGMMWCGVDGVSRVWCDVVRCYLTSTAYLRGSLIGIQPSRNSIFFLNVKEKR